MSFSSSVNQNRTHLWTPRNARPRPKLSPPRPSVKFLNSRYSQMTKKTKTWMRNFRKKKNISRSLNSSVKRSWATWASSSACPNKKSRPLLKSKRLCSKRWRRNLFSLEMATSKSSRKKCKTITSCNQNKRRMMLRCNQRLRKRRALRLRSLRSQQSQSLQQLSLSTRRSKRSLISKLRRSRGRSKFNRRSKRLMREKPKPKKLLKKQLSLLKRLNKLLMLLKKLNRLNKLPRLLKLLSFSNSNRTKRWSLKRFK